ncbi:MAG: DUF4085 domain-containing protein [Gorillibacterium sp.]|nr:DUF4085 domain-containing protein [Gorillibacterium sp.]
MKYLTKKWYELCQRTGLHSGMRVHKGADIYDEALYLRLYKRKEKEFVKMQREVYDVDPRFMLEQEGCRLVPLDKFERGEEINEEDMVVYHMPLEERERIQKWIEDYNTRSPFDEKKCREEFRLHQEALKKETANKLPHDLSQQITDMRVFSLGYCTGEVLNQLKRLSKENEKKVNSVLNEYSKAQQAEPIPQIIRERFGFHDCVVTELTIGTNVVMCLDTRGGFTSFNRITFTVSEIIKQDEHIVGSTWIYDELYSTENGYEAHMLLGAGEGMPELILRCNDIIIEKSEGFS